MQNEAIEESQAIDLAEDGEGMRPAEPLRTEQSKSTAMKDMPSATTRQLNHVKPSEYRSFICSQSAIDVIM